jgi:hypothetical protein
VGNKLQLCICKDNTTVGGITLYVEDKGGHHSVFELYPILQSYSSRCRVIPLTVGHNVNLNKLHFFRIFHIFSLLNLLFFHIFHIFSPFNLFFFQTFQIGGITLYVEDKGGHHSVFGHIPVQKEKYYIIRIKKWLFGNRLLHLYTIFPIISQFIYFSSLFCLSFHY